MCALAVKVQGTAGTTIANQAALQQLNSAIQAGEKRQALLQTKVDNLIEFLENAVGTIEKSYRELEHNCVSAVNSVATHSKEGLASHAGSLENLKKIQEEEHDRIVYTHRLADEGGYKTRLGEVCEGKIGQKVKALEQEVTTLQEKINALEAQGRATPEPTKEAGVPDSSATGDASLIQTVEARLEAKIEAAMEASTVIVADTMNARFDAALKLFEGYVTRRREDEEAARVQRNPPAPPKPSSPRVTTPKPT